MLSVAMVFFVSVLRIHVALHVIVREETPQPHINSLKGVFQFGFARDEQVTRLERMDLVF